MNSDMVNDNILSEDDKMLIEKCLHLELYRAIIFAEKDQKERAIDVLEKVKSLKTISHLS